MESQRLLDVFRRYEDLGREVVGEFAAILAQRDRLIAALDTLFGGGTLDDAKRHLRQGDLDTEHMETWAAVEHVVADHVP